MKTKFSTLKLKEIFIGIMLCLLSFGVLGWALNAYLKVKDGQGLDYYISGTGYQFNYIGVLILFALIPIALGGGWIIGRFLIWRDEKRQIAIRKLKWEKNKQFNRVRKRGRTRSSKKIK